MELFTISTIWISMLFGALVVAKCIVLPGLNNRLEQVTLPGNTPMGVAKDDCLLGTTATLPHLVSRRGKARPLSQFKTSRPNN